MVGADVGSFTAKNPSRTGPTRRFLSVVFNASCETRLFFEQKVSPPLNRRRYAESGVRVVLRISSVSIFGVSLDFPAFPEMKRPIPGALSARQFAAIFVSRDRTCFHPPIGRGYAWLCCASLR